MILTPKDYIDATPDLAQAGFGAIKTLLSDNDDGTKTPDDIVALYGVRLKTVELVKTTSSYSQYQTVSRLESEREALEQELDDVKTTEATVKPKTWHYVVAAVILIVILSLIVWGVVALIGWIRGM